MGTIVAEYTSVNGVLFADALPVGRVIVASTATKVDPNTLEGAVPTVQGDYQRVTVTNHTVVGTTMDQALTYTTPLIAMDGTALTASWEDLIRVLIKVSASATQVDLRIWCGLSEGGVAAAAKGIAVGLGYSATGWQVYRASNNAASAWSAATAAAATPDTNTRAGLLSAQFSAATSQATMMTKALNGSLAPINTTNLGMSNALALSSPAMTHFFIGFDWITGAGGTDGITVDVKGIAACLNLTSIPNVT